MARVLGKGARGSLGFAAGIALGDIVWLSFAAGGLAVLAQSFATVFLVIKYAGVAYLHLPDTRDKGVSMLQQVADKNDERASDLARLALAENAVVQGNIDEAIGLYEKLQNSSQVLKPSVQIALGRLYDKKGDKQKAADYFFEAAKADRTTGAGTDAEKRLSAIAPERIKDLPPAISNFQP